MPTSSKRPSKSTVTPRVKRLATASAASTLPFLRFYYSKSLRAKTLAVLATVEKAKDSKQHRDALANIVVELTDSGMEYFYLKPLKLANVGFLVQQSANLGMTAPTGIMSSAIRTIIGRMDQAQLLAVCGYILSS